MSEADDLAQEAMHNYWQFKRRAQELITVIDAAIRSEALDEDGIPEPRFYILKKAAQDNQGAFEELQMAYKLFLSDLFLGPSIDLGTVIEEGKHVTTNP